MEKLIGYCGDIFKTYIRIEDHQGVIQYLSNKKNWSDTNFCILTQNSNKFIADACSIACYCQLVLSPKLNLNKLGKCAEVVNNALCIIDCKALPAREYLGNLIVKNFKHSKRTLLKKFYFIRKIQNFPKELLRIVECELENRLSTGIRDLFFHCESRMLVKILSFGLQLSFYNLLKRTDFYILRTLAYQCLENDYNLFQVQGIQGVKQGVDDGVVICKIIEIIDDGKDPLGFLRRFAGRIFDFMSVDINAIKYPCTINKIIEHGINLNEVSEFNLILEALSENIKVTKYNCKSGPSLNFNIKIYIDSSFNQNTNMELVHYQKITKLSIRKNFTTEKLLKYEIPSPGQLILYFDSFSLPFIIFLTTLSSKKTHIEEFHLKKISSNLIKICHNLERKKIHHGNLKPHHLYLNNELDITISNFPLSGIVDYDSCYADDFKYIQGVNGYTAPEAPKQYSPFFNYRKNKSEVFSVGLILIQSYLLEPVDSISNCQETINKYTSLVKYDWLQALLTKMLVFDKNHRSNFKQLYSIIKKF